MSEYPEHEKLKQVSGKSQAIGEFIDWLIEVKGYRICERDPEADEFSDIVWQPIRMGVIDLLAERFGIDQDKIEEEKRRMIAKLAAMNEREE